jgi:hypothetical protein
VEIESGRYGAARPQSASDAPVGRQIPGDSLEKDNKGQLKKLISRLPFTYLVLVRPGEGAWEMTAGDGGKDDHDHQVDGKIELSPDDLRPIGHDAPAPPDQFRKGDVILLFAPQDNTYFFARLGE